MRPEILKLREQGRFKQISHDAFGRFAVYRFSYKAVVGTKRECAGCEGPGRFIYVTVLDDDNGWNRIDKGFSPHCSVTCWRNCDYCKAKR